MNAVTDIIELVPLAPQRVELIEPETESDASVSAVDFEPRPMHAPAVIQPQQAPKERQMSVVDYAVQSGAPVSEVRALLELQVHADNHQLALMKERRVMDKEDRAVAAVLAYRRDFAAFRGAAIVVPRTKTVDRGTGGSFAQAEFYVFSQMLSPALSKHGFSFRHDQKFGSKAWTTDGVINDIPWVYVTCFLEHKDGHVERLDLEGPPGDTKVNTPVQNMQVTASVLKRQSLAALTGTATGGEDDEAKLKRGAGGAADPLEVWSGRAALAATLEELGLVAKDGAKLFKGAGNVEAYKLFAQAVRTRGAALRAAIDADPFIKEMDASRIAQ